MLVDEPKEKVSVFLWDNGKLTRVYTNAILVNLDPGKWMFFVNTLEVEFLISTCSIPYLPLSIVLTHSRGRSCLCRPDHSSFNRIISQE